MTLKLYMVLPAVIFVGGAVYYFLSGDPAGTTMTIFFAAAMALMGWILVPTLQNVGPTAPVDPDWHERERR